MTEPGFDASLSASTPRLASSARYWRLILLGCPLIMLGACASPPRAAYDLAAATGGSLARAPKGQLAVFQPTATLAADSDRIVVRTGSDAVAYLAGAQWTSRLPALVQARLIESFENSPLLRAVGPTGAPADHSLQTDIRRFELDIARKQAAVEINARIIDSAGRIIFERAFSASAPAADDEAATVVAALDGALGNVMRQIVQWTAAKV